ncbi:MAG: DUF5819 family protein [Bacteroidota bacterium]
MLVFEYCFPQSDKASRLERISHLYIYPVFQQNWGLFVPAPSTERKLFIRYKMGSNFTPWEDILSNEIVAHKKNRLLGNEARVLLLSNSLIYELIALDSVKSCVFTTVQQNKEFKVLQFETQRYLKLQHRLTSVINYEVLLVSKGKEGNKAYYMKDLTGN